jgi:hypothetical protein
MKYILLSVAIMIVLFSVKCKSPDKENIVLRRETINTVPKIFPCNHDDLIYSKTRHEAMMKFTVHQLPDNLADWEKHKTILKETITCKTGFSIDHSLPLDLKESGSVKMEGYTIKNIIFQTRENIYATANLYIPDGEGPFPGVVVMAGHYINGRLGGVQSLGYTLALNGFVALTIDPWGAGERTTKYREYEYHGANLGASLLNIGESLMGLQITDNMRAVDLLCSLPYVDPEKIGATGASGGGNQTMWLTAMDERIKAAVPVVSVGTFESYVMGHNCICETLADGLTFTEESGILALAAPRALLISNGLRDSNTAFYPSEMLRSYNNAMPVFQLYNAEENFKHLIFDGPHSYPPETREAMLDLFNIHLKGTDKGSPGLISRNDRLDEEKIINFPAGDRHKSVITTAEYCKIRGNELRNSYLSHKSFKVSEKKKKLREVLKIKDLPVLYKVYEYPTENQWQKFALETSDGKLIPLLNLTPVQNSEKYVILCNPDGGVNIPLTIINDYYKQGAGIVVVDLSGTGEAVSQKSENYDKLAPLHTLARAELWLGKTLTGEWVKELNSVVQFLTTHFKAEKITIDGTREAGLAGLFLKAAIREVHEAVLRNSPPSYLFDNRETIDYFSMGIHIPGILKWGDVSLAAGIAGGNITFIDAVTMSGRDLRGSELEKYKDEFENIISKCKNRGTINFCTTLKQ